MKRADYNDFRYFKSQVNRTIKRAIETDTAPGFTSYLDENKSSDYKKAISDFLATVGYFPFGFNKNQVTDQIALVFISFRDYKEMCSGHDYLSDEHGNYIDLIPVFTFVDAKQAWEHYTTKNARDEWKAFIEA